MDGWMLGGCKIENRFHKFPPSKELSTPPTRTVSGRKERSEREKRFAEQTNQLGQVIGANLSIKFIIYRYLQFTAQEGCEIPTNVRWMVAEDEDEKEDDVVGILEEIEGFEGDAP